MSLFFNFYHMIKIMQFINICEEHDKILRLPHKIHLQP
jgi:hypothetical protein